MGVHATVSTRPLRSRVENSTRAIDSSKNVPHRRRREGSRTPAVDAGETRGEIHFREEKPQWFYVVFANYDRKCNSRCDGDFACNLEYAIHCYGRVYVRYNLKFRNGGPDELDEFSYDEAGLVISYALLFGAYSLTLVFAVGMMGLLLARDKFHQTARLLFWCVVFGWVATFLALLHYGVFGGDGRGLPKALRASKFIYLCADCVMLLLLALCAKGWNIVRRKLALWTRVSVCVFLCTYACATIAAFTWHVYDFDPAISVYVYDSPPGHLLIAMRCAGGAWLSLDALSQRAHFKTKVGFYWWFSVIGGLWTASVPFVVFVAALAPDTERLKVTMALEPGLALAVQGALCFLFLPLKQWNPHFPFHSNVTNAAASSLSIKWARDKRPKASDDDGRPLASVSGGRGRGVNDKGQYVIEDGFEALHVQRLKHIHRALESRLDALHCVETNHWFGWS